MTFQADLVENKTIQFFINGKAYSVGSKIPPSTSLLTFIRDVAHLKGTKATCYQGNCGSCTVVVTKKDIETGAFKTFSLRTCQALVYSCNGWNVSTIEHLGDRYKGYHSLQKALTGFYGTQCGFCSPGFVMSVYGELKNNGALTAESVEKNLDGNICRCTGYRPILDAFKSLAIDASTDLKSKLADIEDVFESISKCAKSGQVCKGTCSDNNKDSHCHNTEEKAMSLFDSNLLEDFNLFVGTVQWYRPVSIKGIYKVLQNYTPQQKVRLVVGNTAQGVYTEDGPFNIYIDITGVPELYAVAMGTPLVIGANVSLTRCIEVFRETSKMFQGYIYLGAIADHWENVANVGVRNVASWAGNLRTKIDHKDFPSDIFITLAAVNAVVKLGHSADSSTTEVTMENLINADLSRSIILSLTFPQHDQNVYIRSYKISPTTVNSVGIVNAAFNFKLDTTNHFKIIEKPNILFGGINDTFVHATDAETFLTGKNLDDETTLQGALDKIKLQVHPSARPDLASPQYRTSLALSLFYKAVLNILGKGVSPVYREGGEILKRPLNTGKQTFDANSDTWPVGQAIPKLESNIQVAGEAEYLDDIEPLHDELHGAFVQSSEAKAKIKSIDTSVALNLPGVVAYIDQTDIKGRNTYLKAPIPEPVFTSSEVRFCGQPIGLIVAKTRDIAVKAAKMVTVEYINVLKPILTIKEALKPKMEGDANSNSSVVPPPTPHPDPPAPHTVTGELDIGTQHPMMMEPLAARVVPMEDGYDVYCTTQGPTTTQFSVAQVLDVSNNSINLSVRRIGGAFGGKIDRGNLPACAAAVAAQKLMRPVRVVLDLTAGMSLVGWREPFYSKYQVGFDDVGKILSANIQFISDCGHAPNDNSSMWSYRAIPNVYFCDKWNIEPGKVSTDTASNTYTRTPGTTEAIATMENIIEHIASYLKQEASKIREINFTDTSKQKSEYGPRGENLIRTTIFPLLKEQSMFDTRRQQVDAFNKVNRWRKRGLSIMPIFYRHNFPPSFRYNVLVTIYHNDGSVVVSCGGIEMGQGLYTKVAQVAAHTLQIPISLIKVKPSNVVTGSNSSVTAGSFGSDVNAHGIRIACEKLRTRIDRVRPNYPKDITWPRLIRACSTLNMDLSERYWTDTTELPEGQDIFAAACLEVELDVLTGQHMIRQADIIEDCGRSLSPYVDIGQIEGSFIMALGLYTTEEVKYNVDSGRKLTDRLWNYHPPSALDIPVNFIISLLPKGDAGKTGVLGSKATGEPAVCLGFVIVTALRDAIKSARADAGDDKWFEMHPPLTTEKIQQLCMVESSQFKIYQQPSPIGEKIHPMAEYLDFHVVEKEEAPMAPQEDGCAIN